MSQPSRRGQSLSGNEGADETFLSYPYNVYLRGQIAPLSRHYKGTDRNKYIAHYKREVIQNRRNLT
jgi:hypothetical protein